jgi:hypothetical protein
MNGVGMNLARGDQRPAAGSEFVRECGAVVLDSSFGIVRSESKIECVAAVGTRRPCCARGESVDEPGNFAEACGAKNVEFGLLGNLLRNLLGNPGRHPTMLPGGPALAHHGQKFFFICAHLLYQHLIASIFVGGCPEHHFS